LRQLRDSKQDLRTAAHLEPGNKAIRSAFAGVSDELAVSKKETAELVSQVLGFARHAAGGGNGVR
jgi:hypothetical protein